MSEYMYVPIVWNKYSANVCIFYLTENQEIESLLGLLPNIYVQGLSQYIHFLSVCSCNYEKNVLLIVSRVYIYRQQSV